MIQREPHSFTVNELRAVLQQKGLPVGGNKNDLILRLDEADPEGRWREVEDLGADAIIPGMPLASDLAQLHRELELERRERALLQRELDVTQRELALARSNVSNNNGQNQANETPSQSTTSKEIQTCSGSGKNSFSC